MKAQKMGVKRYIQQNILTNYSTFTQALNSVTEFLTAQKIFINEILLAKCIHNIKLGLEK